MNILYISQYFPPEIGATQVRAKENVLHLRDFGHSITVLTEMPNHPEGIIRAGYRNKLFVREQWQGISILRVWIFTRPEKTFFSRILFYVSFMIMGMIFGTMFLRKKFHVVYASSPPFFVGFLGLVLSKLVSGKFVFEVRDLWPQSAIELGALNNKHFINLAEKLENYYYKKSSLIVAVTRGIYDTIMQKKMNSHLIFIPNGANTEIYHPDYPISNEIKSLYKKKFVVIYTGVIGLIHGVDTVIEAANLLQKESGILFLIIGDGAKKKEMEALVNHYQLDNVQFIKALQEHELIPYVVSAQVALATAKKMAITRGTLPVKMFSSMSCAVPVVLSVSGEAATLLHSANAGLVVEPDNAAAMANAILKLYQNRELAKKLGKNGRRFVEKHFDRRMLAQKLNVNILKTVNDD